MPLTDLSLSRLITQRKCIEVSTKAEAASLWVTVSGGAWRTRSLPPEMSTERRWWFNRLDDMFFSKHLGFLESYAPGARIGQCVVKRAPPRRRPRARDASHRPKTRTRIPRARRYVNVPVTNQIYEGNCFL